MERLKLCNVKHHLQLAPSLPSVNHYSNLQNPPPFVLPVWGRLPPAPALAPAVGRDRKATPLSKHESHCGVAGALTRSSRVARQPVVCAEEEERVQNYTCTQQEILLYTPAPNDAPSTLHTILPTYGVVCGSPLRRGRRCQYRVRYASLRM
jgi:hypothetical protein